MRDLTAVYQYIADHRDEFIEELIPLVQHKSVSMTHDGIKECAEFLVELEDQLDVVIAPSQVERADIDTPDKLVAMVEERL